MNKFTCLLFIIMPPFFSKLALAEPNWFDQSPLIQQTLMIDDRERQRLSLLEREELVTIRPVALPEGKHLVAGNRNLGWPVGAKVGDTLLCVFYRKFAHHGKPKFNEHSSRGVVVRSTDGGTTWSDPVDLKSVGAIDTKQMSNGFGIAIGVIDRTVVVVTQHGVFRSTDEGKSWELLSEAMTRRQTGVAEDARYAIGPRLIIHPEKGLVLPAGSRHEPVMQMFCSSDRGETWTREVVDVTPEVHPLEPTGIYHDGQLIFVTRNHPLPFRWGRKMHEPSPPGMIVADDGWFPAKHIATTNISSFRWPDTTDVDFNPVTKRYEAVVTNRSGGVLGNELNTKHGQTINLWSIAPDDLAQGRADRWRYEATLLRLKTGMFGSGAPTPGPDDVDAAHPGGAVIDAEAGVQHVFIYCGTFATPTGVYRITRTLETDQLRAAPHASGE